MRRGHPTFHVPRCREGERGHGGEAGAPPARCGGGWLVPIDAPLLGALGHDRGRPRESPPRFRVGPGAAAPDRGTPARPGRRPPRRGQIERWPREAPGARGHLLMPRRGGTVGGGRGGRGCGWGPSSGGRREAEGRVLYEWWGGGRRCASLLRANESD